MPGCYRLVKIARSIQVTLSVFPSTGLTRKRDPQEMTVVSNASDGRSTAGRCRESAVGPDGNRQEARRASFKTCTAFT
jgi:hypothetical protein